MEQTRRAGTPSSSNDTDTPAERLTELTGILRERVAIPRLDEGDEIAMRTLLEEIHSLTAELRGEAARLHQRLETASTNLRQVYQRLNDDGNV